MTPETLNVMVRLKDLIHREKGLELHTKPNHKNSSQLDMQKKISKIIIIKNKKFQPHKLVSSTLGQ